jgi:hypothetical protein
VHKKFLMKAAGCNLALLMRSLHGSGKPRAAHDRVSKVIFAFLVLMNALDALWPSPSANFRDRDRFSCRPRHSCRIIGVRRKPVV